MDEKSSKAVSPIFVIVGIALASLIVGCTIGFKINADQVREAAIVSAIEAEDPDNYAYISYGLNSSKPFIGSSSPSGRIENRFGQVVTRFGGPGAIDAPIEAPQTNGVGYDSLSYVYAPGLGEATFYPDLLSSFNGITFYCGEGLYSKYSSIYISSDWTSVTRATVNVTDCYVKIEGWNFRCNLQLSSSSYMKNGDVDLDLYSDREIDMSRKDEHTVVLTSPGTLAVKQGDNESIDPVRDKVENITIKESPNGKKPTVTFNEHE